MKRSDLIENFYVSGAYLTFEENCARNLYFLIGFILDFKKSALSL